MLLETTNSLKNKTILDFGAHQSIGSPGLNHGKIPLLYAKSNRSGDKSPPTASMPSELVSETGGKYNTSEIKYIWLRKLLEFICIHLN
jgi:hypothetical protein